MFQHLMRLQQEAQESDEERAQRLEQTAAEAGADPHVLYDTERHVEQAVHHFRSENTDKLQEIRTKVRQETGADPAELLNGMLTADDVARVVAKGLLSNPEATATAVLTLHRTFQASGLYDDLETQAPDPATFEPPVSVEGGEDDATR